jgi:hypothetical protein
MDVRLPDKTGNYQVEREERTADKAGPKMIQVTQTLATTRDRGERGERYA